ncbi:MAG: hypothetical protein CMC15_16885 [Flavobacteriaceae bacterium]|nr:hypothetical protein [Flavobacteriaceae bacterium]
MAKFNVLIAAKTTGKAGITALGNSMQGLAGKVKNVQASMLGMNKVFGVFIALSAAGGLARTVKQSIDLADSFGKMSDQTGIAANTLMAYVDAGKLAGVNQEQIDKGLRRLSRSIVEADRGIATYKRSFDTLGISLRDNNNELKTTEVVFGEIAEKFSQLENGATKAAVAQELFGRSGVNLINLLNNGKAALSEFNVELSENFAQNAEYFNDQIAVIGIGIKNLNASMTDSMLPALNASAEAFRGLTETSASWKALFTVLEAGFRVISYNVYLITSLLKALSRTIVDLTKIVWNLMKLDFDEIKRIAKEGLSDFWNQAGDDIKNLWKILSDTSDAPENYTNQIKGLAAQLDKTFGGSMRAKLDAFTTQMNDFGGMVADVVVKSFKSLEDQLVSFVTTGKLEFRKLAQSIIADMARIAIRATIIKPIMAGFGLTAAKGAVVENGQHLTAYAKGGIVNKPTIFPMANGMGLMGEAGPEAILPLTRRNGVLGVEGGGGTNVVVNVDASGTQVQGNEQEGRALGQLIAAAVQSELVQQSRPGGLLNPA